MITEELAYDEIFSNLLMLRQSKKNCKKIKKRKKNLYQYSKQILKNFPYKLTEGQNEILKELDADIKSKHRMFRLIQGDVGSGKTILALILAAKVCKSKYQVAYMAPTEILSKQQYYSGKKLYELTNINVDTFNG